MFECTNSVTMGQWADSNPPFLVQQFRRPFLVHCDSRSDGAQAQVDAGAGSRSSNPAFTQIGVVNSNMTAVAVAVESEHTGTMSASDFLREVQVQSQSQSGVMRDDVVSIGNEMDEVTSRFLLVSFFVLLSSFFGRLLIYIFVSIF